MTRCARPRRTQMTWVHVLLYNLPPETTGLPEGVANKALRWHAAGRQRLAAYRLWRTVPADRPPSLFPQAVCAECRIADLKQPTKAVLEKAMQGHILAHAELIGVYQRAH